jgi:sulfonate transport system substrate-binding protein
MFSSTFRNIAPLLRILVALLAGSTLAMPAFADQRDPLRIGYQKYGTLIILKARGSLEKRLAPLNVDVRWIEFPAGPQLLEGLNVGSIDFGTVGEAPPIFAQAAGANLVYVGNEPPAPASEALIVPRDSPVKTVRDLKGKRIALNKGSNVHYLLVKVLEANGLKYSDVEPVFLPPADARAAFERGSVDAWVIWDPFLAAAEKQIGARIVADGRGVTSNHQFYLAARPYAERRADIVNIVLEEIGKIDEWSRQNPKEVSAILAPAVGIEPAAVDLALSRYAYGVAPISPFVIGEQQKIADTFFDLKLIPKSVAIKDVVWQPKSTVARSQ